MAVNTNVYLWPYEIVSHLSSIFHSTNPPEASSFASHHISPQTTGRAIPSVSKGCLSLKDPLSHLVSQLARASSIFVERDVLRSDYIPSSLPHRAGHLRQLGEMLSPALAGHRPSNIFIYGKTGTGKTAVLKHVLDRFSSEAKKLRRNVRFVYVNCRLLGTEYRVLAALAASIGVPIPFTGLATAEVFRRLSSGLAKRPGTFILGLDEIDALVKVSGDNLLYELTRINESLPSSRVSLVGVSNDLMWKELLGPRVLSSLSEQELVFHPYSALELADILRERAEHAFRKGVLSNSVTALCSALAASEHGDARRALDLLRVSGEVAERNQSTVITEKHVRMAQGVIERGRVFEALTSLPLHSRIMLAAVLSLTRQRSDVTSGTVYSAYKELSTLLNVDPLTQRRVSGLISELDMMGVLGTKLVSFGRYGRTKKLKLLVPIDDIASVLENDELLSPVLTHPPSDAGPQPPHKHFLDR